VRSDLVLTLHDLAARRAAGSVARFERVVIETSGLADPASILQALMIDAAVGESYALDNVVTTVDTVNGASTLDRHAQAVRQAAVADQVVLTKSDLPQARTADLRRRVAALNPEAAIHMASFGALDPAVLLDSQRHGMVQRLGKLGAYPESRQGGTHDSGIAAACFVRERPIQAVALAMFLASLAEHCGAGLLRMKGIVNVKEDPDHPAVIHGVQHVFDPPAWLERWPSEDRRTRMVFIGHDVPPLDWVRELLEVLDAEVADATARLTDAA
jgi:G3E family GTPase